MKLAFLINGNARKYTELQQQLKATFRDQQTSFFISQSAGHLTQLATEAITQGFDHIVICGGDGTLNEGINGIVQAFKLNDNGGTADYDWQKIAQIKVGVLPFGSGNDFSKTVHITKEISYLKNLIENGRSQMVDIGWVSFINTKEQPATRFYMNITDVGMGGETALKLQHKIGVLGPDINYFWAITSSLATYKNVHIEATGDDFHYEGKVINFVVANGRFFGNGLGIAPEASVTDGKFDIVIIGDITLMDYFKNLGKVKRSEKLIHPKVQYHRLQKVSIQAKEDRSITIDMDGEFIGHAPMTLECLAQRICLIC